jgi:hypothetical protein
MMNRREAIIKLGVGGIGVAAIHSATPASALVGIFESGLPMGQAANADLDDRLRKEIAEQSSRSTSEEGVPMFLICVDQVMDKSTGKAPSVAPTALSAAIAAQFRRDTAAWERIQPNAPASDIAKLIQALAERDFAGGGTEQKS